MSFIAQAFAKFGMTIDDVHFDEATDIKTRDQLLAEGQARLGMYCPDIQITMQLGGSEASIVTFQFNDTGNEEDGRVQYDVDVSISNDDSTSPLHHMVALALATEKFYALGLHTRFGTLTGDY